MFVRPFSDIHAEFWQPNKIPRILEMVIPPLPTDKETIALVAGDIGLAHRQETWLKVISILAKQFLAVVYVEGNHFFYHNDFFGRIHELKTKLSFPKNVHFLENESVEINDVLFIGATLWTDFLGKDFFKMQYARKNMNDFVVIKKPDGTRLMPEETVDLFQESKRYIFEALAAAGGRKTVVVTHHGVSPLSIHERFRGDSLNCAFMTDLSDEIIDHGPDLWVHGHTDNSYKAPVSQQAKWCPADFESFSLMNLPLHLIRSDFISNYWVRKESCTKLLSKLISLWLSLSQRLRRHLLRGLETVPFPLPSHSRSVLIACARHS